MPAQGSPRDRRTKEDSSGLNTPLIVRAMGRPDEKTGDDFIGNPHRGAGPARLGPLDADKPEQVEREMLHATVGESDRHLVRVRATRGRATQGGPIRGPSVEIEITTKGLDDLGVEGVLRLADLSHDPAAPTLQDLDRDARALGAPLWTAIDLRCERDALLGVIVLNGDDGEREILLNRKVLEWLHEHGYVTIAVSHDAAYSEPEVFGKRSPRRVRRATRAMKGTWTELRATTPTKLKHITDPSRTLPRLLAFALALLGVLRALGAI